MDDKAAPSYSRQGVHPCKQSLQFRRCQMVHLKADRAFLVRLNIALLML